jgi:hypothetical protein
VTNQVVNFNDFYKVNFVQTKVKVKVKLHPTTGHDDPEVEKRYSSTVSLTSALYGGEWSTSRPGRFNPRKDPVPTVQEAG